MNDFFFNSLGGRLALGAADLRLLAALLLDLLQRSADDGAVELRGLARAASNHNIVGGVVITLYIRRCEDTQACSFRMGPDHAARFELLGVGRWVLTFLAHAAAAAAVFLYVLSSLRLGPCHGEPCPCAPHYGVLQARQKKRHYF